MIVFHASTTTGVITRSKRKFVVVIAASAFGAIVLSGISAASAGSASPQVRGVGVASEQQDPRTPKENSRSLSTAPDNRNSLGHSKLVFRASKEDPLGFSLMMAQVRELERLAEVTRLREIRKAEAARKRALAKKRAAAKRRAAAKKRAAEKKRLAAAKRAAEEKERAEIESRSAAGWGHGGLVIGDSVALGAEACLARHGFDVDAVQSRSFSAGYAALVQKPRDSLPGNVVIHLGTNGPFSAGDFHAVMSHIGGDRLVTWVTIALPDRDPYGFEASLNLMIKDLARSYDNTSIADWNAVSQGMGHWFYDDQIHINSQGCEGFGNVVNAAGR